jgi:hypothetical protein
VQVLPLQIGKLGRKQSAIPFNVLPMTPHLGSFEVNHPPSPLWMFLSRLVDWIGELAAAQIAWTNESQAPVWNTASARFSTNHTFRKLYGDDRLMSWHSGVRIEPGKLIIFRTMHVNSGQNGRRYSPSLSTIPPLDVKVLIEAFEQTLHVEFLSIG